MNNFVFSQDPLLYNPPVSHNLQPDIDIKRQLDNVLMHYQNLQKQQPEIEDHLGKLDEIIKSLDPNILDTLNKDDEFSQIYNWIQQNIQNEIIKVIKPKLNNNPEFISKINRAKDIIMISKNNQEAEDRKSLNELNEYITNYSDMTFNEYKQLKLSKQKQNL